MEIKCARTTISGNEDITDAAASPILYSSDLLTGISVWQFGSEIWRIHSSPWFKRHITGRRLPLTQVQIKKKKEEEKKNNNINNTIFWQWQNVC